MKQRLAIIGASYLQLPLVLKARAMGVETLCFAWEEGAVAKDHCDRFYPISIVDKDDVLEVCARENIDGIVSIASDLAVPTVSCVAQKLHLVGNSVRSAELCSNKYHMRGALSAAGLRCPGYLAASSSDDSALSSMDLRYPLIVKPVDRSGSLGVTQIMRPSELADALEVALRASFAGQAVVEEFIEGVEVSVETVSWAGKHYHLAVTDKKTSGSPHFVELAHHQPSALPDGIRDKIRTETAAGLDALQVAHGASHAEFIVAKDEVYVTEIGARMGGDFIGSDLVRLSTGYDFIEGVVQIALGRFEPPNTGLGKCSGVYFYSRETPDVMKLIRNKESYPQIVRAECTSSTLAPLKSSSDRSGYAIYQSDRRFVIG